MKIQKSHQLSAFGGINFVFEYLDILQMEELFNENLPHLKPQSKYKWKDIIYSLIWHLSMWR